MRAPHRTAIVTGGAGDGIGAGISRALADDGWAVAIVDVDGTAADRVAAELRDAGASAGGYAFDVGSPAGHERLVADVEQDLGPCSLLVNSAGVGLLGRVGEIALDDWDRLMAIDLRGAWLMSRAVLAPMERRGTGCIVHIGSVQALGAAERYGVYAAAKAGLAGLSRGIAADYGPSGIRSVIVHPGLVDSPQNRELFRQFGGAEAFIADYLATRQMINHLLQPLDIGRAVAFLGSEAARGITAAEIVVDGGSSAMAFDRARAVPDDGTGQR